MLAANWQRVGKLLWVKGIQPLLGAGFDKPANGMLSGMVSEFQRIRIAAAIWRAIRPDCI